MRADIRPWMCRPRWTTSEELPTRGLDKRRLPTTPPPPPPRKACWGEKQTEEHRLTSERPPEGPYLPVECVFCLSGYTSTKNQPCASTAIVGPWKGMFQRLCSNGDMNAAVLL